MQGQNSIIRNSEETVIAVDTEKRDKKYNRWARQYPACICLSFWLVIFLYYLMATDEIEVDNVKYIFNTLLSLGSIVPALFFMYMFVIRDMSKCLEDGIYKLFGKPTTNLLTVEDSTFSKEKQIDIRKKIATEFNCKLNVEENCSKTNKAYCKHVDEAVQNIREKTRYSNILFEFNCIYGFYRNLSGGLLLNLLLMLIFFLFPIERGLIAGLILIDLSILILSLIFTILNGNRYAKRLYIVYLMTKND